MDVMWNAAYFTEGFVANEKSAIQTLDGANGVCSMEKSSSEFYICENVQEMRDLMHWKDENQVHCILNIWEEAGKQWLGSTGGELCLEHEKWYKVEQAISQKAKETDGTKKEKQWVLACCVSNKPFPEGMLGQEVNEQTGGPRSTGWSEYMVIWLFRSEFQDK